MTSKNFVPNKGAYEKLFVRCVAGKIITMAGFDYLLQVLYGQV